MLIAILAIVTITIRRRRARRVQGAPCALHCALEERAMDDPADASISHPGPEAEFGAELRAARKRAGLSLRALARILHRAHSSLVEYERGHRLAPVDVVRAYESALGLKQDTLVALRDNAHAQRCALGRDGSLPDAAPPVPAPAKSAAATSSGRRRLRPLHPAAAVAAAVAVVLGAGLITLGGDAKPRVTTAPSHSSTSPRVTIGMPPRAEVQRCKEFSGTANLPAGQTLVLGVRNIDNADPKTYFATVVSWSVAPGQGEWSRPLHFGTAIGQKYAVTPLVVARSAVDAVPDKDDATTWANEHPPPTARIVKTVYVTRRAGPGDC